MLHELNDEWPKGRWLSRVIAWIQRYKGTQMTILGQSWGGTVASGRGEAFGLNLVLGICLEARLCLSALIGGVVAP